MSSMAACAWYSVIETGLRWKDAPVVYGPHKTLSNRFVRWSRAGICNLIFRELAKSADPRQGLRRPDLDTACGLRRTRPPRSPPALGRQMSDYTGAKRWGIGHRRQQRAPSHQ